MTDLLLTLLAAAFGAFLLYAAVDWLKYSRMPGLATYYPIVGHLPTAARIDYVNQWVRKVFEEGGYPDVVIMKMGVFDRCMYVTIVPQNVEHVLKTNFENYGVSYGSRGNAMRDFLGDGIFNADGHMWLLQRKLASREFSANRFRTFMSGVFHKAAEKLASTVFDAEIKRANAASKRAEVDLHHWFFTLTLDAFSEIAFGVNIGGLDGKPLPFSAAFDQCQEYVFHRLMKYAGVWKLMKLFNIGQEKEMKRQLAIIDRFVYSLMDDLLEAKNANDSEEGEDLMRRLLPAAKKDNGEYDRKLVRDMLLNIILAGRDTTAASMSWTMYELMKHPEHVATILEELGNYVGPHAALNFDNVAQCHFLQAVLSESQRLNPSVPFEPRGALKADVLPVGNAVIQPGMTVSYPSYVMGVCPKIWGPDAKEFKPQRWLNDDGTYRKEDQYKYPAFNGGRRLCLGLDMANLEMKVVLGTLLRKYKFELVPGQTIIPTNALTLQMAHGMRVIIERR